MSKIAGIYGLPTERATNLLRKMLDQNNELYEFNFTEKSIAMGMNCCKKVERQFCVNGKLLLLMFEGFIANRGELIKSFNLNNQSVTDEELIVIAYLRHNESFIKYIFGNFSITLYDHHSNIIILARDRVGMRSLFYRYKDGVLTWASNINQILKVNNDSKINNNFLKEFLVSLPEANHETAYNDIYRVEAGQIVILKNSTLSKRFYYTFDFKIIEYSKESEYIEHFLELLSRSVNASISSDEKIGFSLSGGLDSSSIYTIAEDLLNKGKVAKKNFVPAFLHLNDRYGNEKNYIEMIQEKYGRKIIVIQADDNWFFKDSIEFTKNLDEPYPLFNVSFASAIPQYLKEKNINVVLSGAKGDELFFGNLNYLSRLFLKGRFINYSKDLKEWNRKENVPFFKLIYKHSLKPIVSNSYKKSRQPNWIKLDSNRKLLDIENMKFNYEDIINYYTFIIKRAGHEWSNQYLYFKNNIDYRAPFSDIKLMEYMAGLPINLKIRSGYRKYLLQQSMKNILPEELRKRVDKGAHTNLFVKGFKNEWINIQPYIKFEVLGDLGWIEPRLLKIQLDKYYLGSFDNFIEFPSIMRALALEIWLKGKLI
ncbi:asparagine synthase (glutamine-hydrolysing) [Scopulibacillus darangshiensis]|uniref:asparagine synthase (glutamine-hydrolyzing) n=2 Tax=Scopulibacillus darangshiensis TaxID=442528 RepID=A0A4R2P7P8_9BACL|nr:asparagine synthase (glutamine-hydrolysing) [Scopulibacillus darangshiensis]